MTIVEISGSGDQEPLRGDGSDRRDFLELPRRPTRLCLGIDVDEVLADFNGGFAKILQLLTKDPGQQEILQTLQTREPANWTWPDDICGPSLTLQAWELIHRYPKFWASLKPLHGAQELFMFQELFVNHDVYFLTCRQPNPGSKAPTEAWLRQMVTPEPTVIVCQDKVAVARGIGLRSLLDDHGPTVVELKSAGVLLRKPYNEAYVMQVREAGGRIVNTVGEYVDLVTTEMWM